MTRLTNIHPDTLAMAREVAPVFRMNLAEKAEWRRTHRPWKEYLRAYEEVWQAMWDEEDRSQYPRKEGLRVIWECCETGESCSHRERERTERWVQATGWAGA